MSNKNRNLREHKLIHSKIKLRTCNQIICQIGSLLIMHHFFYSSLCWSLSAQTFALTCSFAVSLQLCLVCTLWLFVCSSGTNLSGGRDFSAERPHWLIRFWLTQLSTYVWVAGVLYDPGFNMAEEEEEDDDNDDDNQEKYMNVITTYISFIFLDVDCYCHSSLSSSPSSSSLLFKARVV